MRSEGLPLLTLAEQVLARKCQLVVREDNEATIKMVKSGRLTAMRHVGRTHRVDAAWLSEVCKSEDILLTYVSTDEQAADIFTKPFNDSKKWDHVCFLINHFKTATPAAPAGASHGTGPGGNLRVPGGEPAPSQKGS